MYIRCKDAGEQYIIDTERKIVYQVDGRIARVVKFNDKNFDSDNFMRWHPYLEEIETTSSVPREIRKYSK